MILYFLLITAGILTAAFFAIAQYLSNIALPQTRSLALIFVVVGFMFLINSGQTIQMISVDYAVHPAYGWIQIIGRTAVIIAVADFWFRKRRK